MHQSNGPRGFRSQQIVGRGHKALFFLCERLNIHVIDPPLEDAAAEDTKVRRQDFVTTVRSHDAKHGDVVFESECKAAFRYFPRVGATWKATEPPVAKALRESEINEDVHATRPGLAKILRMCTYISAFNLNKVKNDEKCVMRYVDEKEVSLCPRNDENVCVCDLDGNAVLRLLRWKGEAEEVNQVATQLAKFEYPRRSRIGETPVQERERRRVAGGWSVGEDSGGEWRVTRRRSCAGGRVPAPTPCARSTAASRRTPAVSWRVVAS